MIIWFCPNRVWYWCPALNVSPSTEKLVPPTTPPSSVGLVQSMCPLLGPVPSGWYLLLYPPLFLSCALFSQLDEIWNQSVFCASMGRLQYSVGSGTGVQPALYVGSCCTVKVVV